MDANATSRVRLGVIGLGRHWRGRYRPLLQKGRRGFVVQVVHDATFARARAEARRLGCAAAEGVVELVERGDVDAVMLCDHAWHGLWPMEQALRFGKPILCVPPVSVDDERAEMLLATMTADTIVVFDKYVSHSPAGTHLVHLVYSDAHLGEPRVITCDVPAQEQAQVLSMIEWLLWAFSSRKLSPDLPESVQALTNEQGLSTWMLGFGKGRTAQINVYPPGVRGVRLSARVVATKGVAHLRFPDQMKWRKGRVSRSMDWRGRYASERTTLELFKVLIERPTDWRTQLPGLEQALQVLRMAKQR